MIATRRGASRHLAAGLALLPLAWAPARPQAGGIGQVPPADAPHPTVPMRRDTGAATGARGDAGSAGDEALEARTREVASQLRCPVCQGLSIEDSPSELALEMKAVVRDQLRAGRTPEEVRAYFVSKYGEWVLLQPEPAGFNLVVYALPLLALAGGLALVVLAVRRWTTPATPPPVEDDVPAGHV